MRTINKAIYDSKNSVRSVTQANQAQESYHIGFLQISCLSLAIIVSFYACTSFASHRFALPSKMYCIVHFGSFPFCPPPPPFTENVSLHSNSLSKNMVHEFGGANIMHPQSWGQKRKRSHILGVFSLNVFWELLFSFLERQFIGPRNKKKQNGAIIAEMNAFFYHQKIPKLPYF